MVKVSRKDQQKKYGKLDIKNKKIDKNDGYSKNLHKDQKRMLTTARITVPHFQSGIFMKGKSSDTYQRKQDDRLNFLNKARMNEKLFEILNLAKKSDVSNEALHVSPEREEIEPYFEHVKNEFSPLAIPSAAANEDNNRIQSENETTSEEEVDIPEYLFNTQHIFTDDIKNENLEVVYDNFKSFVTSLDNIDLLDDVFTEDFITQEKLDICKQKKDSSLNRRSSSQSSDSKGKESQQSSQNLDGIYKNETTASSKNIEYKRKGTKQLKTNPNYYGFKKNSDRVKVINTLNQHQKNKKEADTHKNFSPENLSGVSMFQCTNKIINESSLKMCNNDEEKSNPLNPLSFLSSTTLPESDILSSMATVFKDEQHLKKPFQFSIFSAPPVPTCSDKHSVEFSPFRFLSQPDEVSNSERRGYSMNITNPSIQEYSPLNSDNFHVPWKFKSPECVKIQSSKIPFDGIISSPQLNNSIYLRDNQSKIDDSVGFHCFNSQRSASKPLISMPEEPIMKINNSKNDACSAILETSPSLGASYIENIHEYNLKKRTQSAEAKRNDHVKSFQPKSELFTVSSEEDEDVREKNFWFRRRMF